MRKQLKPQKLSHKPLFHQELICRDKNFSYQEFEEVFAINIGLAFKSKKDKLNWMSMISEPKGKKASALTRSDLNRLELINTHLANFIDVE